MSTAGIFPTNRPGSSFPLKSSICHYRLVDVQVMATLVQEYVSDSSEDVSVNYVFPLPPDAGVCSFKAVIDDQRIINGVAKEKSIARAEYKEAVAKGKTAGLLEKQHADIFQVFLGNIKPNQKIAVHISFVSIVGHDAASPDSLRLMIPVNIAPRYGSPPPWAPVVSPAKTHLSVTVSVQMTSNIKSITSPTHPIALNLGTDTSGSVQTHDPKLAHISLESTSFLEADIVIVLAVQDLDRPRCTIESDEKSSTDAYALSFVPRFNLPALPRQDYIFLIDRSGSMEGSRIAAVRIALQIMLKSLPARGTSFNLWSFGSNCTSLWPSSQQYSAQTVAAAAAHVDRVDADYGGTEIESALRAVFDNITNRSKEEMAPTTIIVLTDGESWGLEAVFARVREAAEKAAGADSFLRTFVLGIGNDVSKPMCDGIARAGSGQAVYVTENERPEGKLINLLKAARGGVIRDLRVDWGVGETDPDMKDAMTTAKDEDDFEFVSAELETKPEPKSVINLFDESTVDHGADTPLGPSDVPVVLPPPPRIQQAPLMKKLSIPLYPGFRTSIFAIVKRDVPASSTVTITGTVLGQDVTLSLPVVKAPPSRAEDGNGRILHTLAARALIQDWEDLPASPERDAQIVRLGTTYSLASSQTSFIAVDCDTDGNRNTVSADWARKHVREEVAEFQSQFGSYSHTSPFAGADSAPFSSLATGYAAPMAMAMNLELELDGAVASYDSLSALSPGYSPASPSYSPTSPRYSPKSPRYSPKSPRYSPTSARYSPISPPRSPRLVEYGSATPVLAPLSSPYASYDAYAPPRLQAAVSPPYIPSPPMFSPPPPVFSAFIPPPPASLGREPSPPRAEVHMQDGPPTLEKIARAASFDGSFDGSALEGGLSTIPPPPSSMTSLPLTTTAGTVPFPQAEAGWFTLLVLAYLVKHFADQRDAWEILEEKGLEFVRGLVGDVGEMGEEIVEELITSWRAAAGAAL